MTSISYETNPFKPQAGEIERLLRQEIADSETGTYQRSFERYNWQTADMARYKQTTKKKTYAKTTSTQKSPSGVSKSAYKRESPKPSPFSILVSNVLDNPIPVNSESATVIDPIAIEESDPEVHDVESLHAEESSDTKKMAGQGMPVRETFELVRARNLALERASVAAQKELQILKDQIKKMHAAEEVSKLREELKARKSELREMERKQQISLVQDDGKFSKWKQAAAELILEKEIVKKEQSANETLSARLESIERQNKESNAELEAVQMKLASEKETVSAMEVEFVAKCSELTARVEDLEEELEEARAAVVELQALRTRLAELETKSSAQAFEEMTKKHQNVCKNYTSVYGKYMTLQKACRDLDIVSECVPLHLFGDVGFAIKKVKAGMKDAEAAATESKGGEGEGKKVQEKAS